MVENKFYMFRKNYCFFWWLHDFHKKFDFKSNSIPLKFWAYLSRALPDITSGSEVLQIFKIRTVRKPDVLLPGRRTIKTKKTLHFYSFGLRSFDTQSVSRDLAGTYLHLPLRQWGAGNVYILVLSSWKVNIAENPIAMMGL